MSIAKRLFVQPDLFVFFGTTLMCGLCLFF